MFDNLTVAGSHEISGVDFMIWCQRQPTGSDGTLQRGARRRRVRHH